jgi:phage/plasmid primase-like uncharacterized protein
MAKFKDIFPGGMAAFNYEAAGLGNAMHGTSLAHPEADFSDEARRAGVEIQGDAIGDGKIHRVAHRNSKKGELDAWYVLFTDGDIAGGAYGYWNEGGLTANWTARIGREMTIAERADHLARMDIIKEAARVERQRHAQEAADRASDDVSRYVDATDLHPYLRAKQAKAHPGVKTDGAGRLIIPYMGEDGEIKTYQSISGQGPEFAKRFLKDGAKKGTFFEIRGDRKRIFICEGYSTASTVFEATGSTVIVAGDAGSLSGVATIWRPLFPAAQIFIAADNDAYTPAGNAGLIKGRAAAKECGGEVVYPVFTEADMAAHPGGHPTDWNDMKAIRGIEVVQEQIARIAGARGASSKSSAFEFVKVGDLEIAPINWLIEDFMEANSLCQIFGESGHGKSFVALDLAACIATGTDWHGHKVKSGPVFYICGEGHAGIKTRTKAWEIGNGKSLKEAPFYKSVKGAQLADATSAAMVAASIMDMQADTGVMPAAVFIDTLSRNYGADENSTEDMAAFITHLDNYIRVPMGCTIYIIHHSGAADKDRSRGSTALRGALDSEYKVSMDKNKTITVEAKKMKEADFPASIDFTLQPVELPVKKVGSEEFQKGVYLKLASAETGNVVKRNEEKAEALRRANEASGANQLASLTVLRSLEIGKTDRGELDEHPVTVAEWRAACRAGGMDGKDQFRDAMTGLEGRKTISITRLATTGVEIVRIAKPQIDE